MNPYLKKFSLSLLLTSLVVLQFGFVPDKHVAEAADNGLAQKPLMGWSSYSLQVYDGPGNWTSAAKIKATSDAMHEKLQSHGYEYINIDAGWNDGMDGYGRPIPSTKLYPDGFQNVIDYVHHNGQKIGLYMIPGLNKDAYDKDLPIYGAEGCTMKKIAKQPLQQGDYWGFTYKMDFQSESSKGCAQAYVDSLASMFASWGIDFIKFDSVTPGSTHNDTSIDSRDDVEAWSKALAKQNRKIWFELSWRLDHNYIDHWKKYSNGWRVNYDVEAYNSDVGMTQWSNILRLFPDEALWWRDAGPGGWNDFDSLNIGNGSMNGLTKDERQSTMTLWAMSSAQLYTGDDLTKLDSYGLSLLTNDEVIAVNQAGHPAHPVTTEALSPAWYANNGDGTYTVALFNFGSKSANVSVNWSDIGLKGAASVRDLWSHSELGSYNTGYTAVDLEPHASRLFKVTAAGGSSSAVNDDDTGMKYVGKWVRNGDKEMLQSSQNLEIAVSSSSASPKSLTGDGSDGNANLTDAANLTAPANLTDAAEDNKQVEATDPAAAADPATNDSVSQQGENALSDDQRASLASSSHFVYINDDDPSIVYSSGWNHSYNRPFDDFNKDVHYAEAKDAWLTYTFVGTGIDYITETDSSQGNIDFYVDDQFKETVDTKGTGTRGIQQTVYSVSGLTPGVHTLKAVKQSANGYMLIDALKVTSDTLLGDTTGTFVYRTPNDVTTTLPFGANSFTGIKNGAASLTKNTDYTVSSNPATVTIKKSYLANQPTGTTNLSFNFAGGDSQMLAIAMTGDPIKTSTINPTKADFDLKITRQADVTTQLKLNNNELVGISNKGTPLVEGTDYSVNGNVLTIKKAYLAKQTRGIMPLTLTFNGGDPQTFEITVKDSVIEDRYLNINNDDAGIQYFGSWSRNTNRGLGDYMDDVHFAEKNGDYLEYKFNGTGIKFITEKDNSQGLMDVYIDGVFKATVDTTNSPRLVKQNVYEISGLPDGVHTIKAVKKSGSFMLLDMLQVETSDSISTTGVLLDKSQPMQDLTVELLKNVDNFNGISNGSKPLVVGTDYTISGATVTIKSGYLASLANGLAKLTFSFNGDFQQDVHTTTDNGDYYTYTFKGTGIELLSPIGPTQGDIEVFIDGVSKGIFSAASDKRIVQQRLFGITGLSSGLHTIKVVKKSGDYMYADRLNFITPNVSPSNQGGTVTSGGPYVTGGTTEIIQGQVNGSGAAGVLGVDVTRTTGTDGTKKDSVTLGADGAKSAVEKLKAAGEKVATIIIPDVKGETSETKVTIQKEAGRAFADGNLSLGITTSNAGIVIPNASLQGYDGDAVFTFTPLKDAAAKQGIQDRASKASVVTLATNGGKATVIGEPVAIDTNFQGRAVDVILPLNAAQLEGLQGSQLGVYIEHSDGTTAFKPGTIVDWQGGKGLRFTVDKFSTFAIVKSDGAAKHTAYMNGFSGGLFKPNQSLTRAEMATILSRIVHQTGTGEAKAFSDVKPAYWAADAIANVTKQGLMRGYGDGTFKPEQPITRAEMATLVAALLPQQTKDGAGFSDIEGSWAAQAIVKVQGAGIIRGYEDGTFRPGNMLTRAEAVAIINRALGRGPLFGDVKLPWTDVPSTHWAYADIAEATMDHAYTARAEGGEQLVPAR